VLVVQKFLDCGLREAVDIVNDLMTSRMRQFERIVAIELPALSDEFDMVSSSRAALVQYAEELQDWLAGILHWHERSRRYEESELRYQPEAEPARFGTLTGLGTSAARILAERR